MGYFLSSNPRDYPHSHQHKDTNAHKYTSQQEKNAIAAPLVVKVRSKIVVRTPITLTALRKLATTPELKSMLARIEQETIPDVRKAWLEQFMAKARCPICGSPIRVSGDSVRCSRGHLL